MRLIVILVLSLLAAVPAIAQSKRAYVCADTDATGFKRDQGKDVWRNKPFVEKRFTLTFDGQTATMKLSGEPRTFTYRCSVPWTERPNLFMCTDPSFYMFNFDEGNLRYVFAMGFGYIDKNDDTPTISIGDCQNF